MVYWTMDYGINYTIVTNMWC